MSLNEDKKILLGRFLLEISDYQDSDARKKISGFSPQNFSTNVTFSIEILMEEFKLVVAQEYKFE